MYGLTLVAIRLLGSALDAYARHEHLYSPAKEGEELQGTQRKLLPAVIGYVIAILIGLALPVAAVALYFGLAVYLVMPFGRSHGCCAGSTALPSEPPHSHLQRQLNRRQPEPHRRVLTFTYCAQELLTQSRDRGCQARSHICHAYLCIRNINFYCLPVRRFRSLYWSRKSAVA